MNPNCRARLTTPSLRISKRASPPPTKSARMFTQYDDLIREYGHELAVSQIRSIVSGRMKKILATRKGNALQLRLGLKFGDLEPESAITFRDDAGAIRITRGRPNECHRHAALF